MNNSLLKNLIQKKAKLEQELAEKRKELNKIQGILNDAFEKEFKEDNDSLALKISDNITVIRKETVKTEIEEKKFDFTNKDFKESFIEFISTKGGIKISSITTFLKFMENHNIDVTKFSSEVKKNEFVVKMVRDTEPKMDI